jgi:hypothetical protein
LPGLPGLLYEFGFFCSSRQRSGCTLAPCPRLGVPSVPDKAWQALGLQSVPAQDGGIPCSMAAALRAPLSWPGALKRFAVSRPPSALAFILPQGNPPPCASFSAKLQAIPQATHRLSCTYTYLYTLDVRQWSGYCDVLFPANGRGPGYAGLLSSFVPGSDPGVSWLHVRAPPGCPQSVGNLKRFAVSLHSLGGGGGGWGRGPARARRATRRGW